MRILTIALNPTLDVSSEARRVQPTHKVRAHGQRMQPGGGGVNVARIISELGGGADLLLFSGGATGALLEDALAQTPIGLDILHVRAATRIATMIREEETGLEYRFVPEGEPVTEHDVLNAITRVAAHAGDYVVASGSLPPGAPADTYAKMAAAAKRRGARFVLDTSGPALKCALEGGDVFLVKPSHSELEALTGRTLSREAAEAEALNLVAERKAQCVATTFGGEGATLAHEGGMLRLASPKVEVRSAVGSGDSFVGALVWALSEGQTLIEAFRLGVAAGAATAMTAGTDLCKRAEILDLLERVGTPV